MISAQFRPIDRWPREATKGRRPSNFTAGQKDTLEKLDKELSHLRARGVVIQLALTEQDIRQDGWPRARARVDHPGVILSFESKHGPLSFACDAFTEWEDNLRGIALTLERLRMADLYGVTKHGEQYKGWKALPEGEGAVRGDDVDSAACFIANHTTTKNWQKVRDVPECFKDGYREAAWNLHPDHGGTHEAFVMLQNAKRVLEAHHGLKL